MKRLIRNRRLAVFAVLVILAASVAMYAQTRLRSRGADVSITSTGAVSVTPFTSQGISLNSGVNITGNTTAAGYLSVAGQLTVTKDPANGTNTSASLLVNPATSAANEPLLAVLDNGTTRFLVDKEGDATHAGLVTLNGGATFGAGSNVTLDSSTAVATAGAATLNKQSGTITSEALTTAAQAAYTLTITNSVITATSRVTVSVDNGTNTQGIPVVSTVTPGSGSVIIAVYNLHASQALNGTLKVSFVAWK